MVHIDIICVSEILTNFPSWSTEFFVAISLEAGGQSRVATKVRKGTKHLFSDPAVLGGVVVLSAVIPLPPGSGFLVHRNLITWENCSSLPPFSSPLLKPPVSSHTELTAVARGDSIMRGKLSTKGLKEENRPDEKKLPKRSKNKQKTARKIIQRFTFMKP